MNNALIVDTSLHWAAVIIYAIATVVNAYGLIFKKERAERISYFIILSGLLIHGIALIYRWTVAGHGPYMTRYEVLSSNRLDSSFPVSCLCEKVLKDKTREHFCVPFDFPLDRLRDFL